MRPWRYRSLGLWLKLLMFRVRQYILPGEFHTKCDTSDSLRGMRATEPI